MQPRRHRFGRQQRRMSARQWQASGAKVSVKSYRRRYGVDGYTAYEDLTAIGFNVGPADQRWAKRPRPEPRPKRPPEPIGDLDVTVIDGRPFFVVGRTAGGAPYGAFLDEDTEDSAPPF